MSLFKTPLKQAVVCYDKAIELDPEDDTLYLFKAECLVKLGQSNEAKKYFNKAKIKLREKKENKKSKKIKINID